MFYFSFLLENDMCVKQAFQRTGCTSRTWILTLHRKPLNPIRSYRASKSWLKSFSDIIFIKIFNTGQEGMLTCTRMMKNAHNWASEVASCYRLPGSHRVFLTAILIKWIGKKDCLFEELGHLRKKKKKGLVFLLISGVPWFSQWYPTLNHWPQEGTW